MKLLKEFIIPFVGLKDKKHLFDYQIDDKFFEHFGYEEFTKANIHVELEFDKKSTVFELNFNINGTVGVFCDVTNEPFDLPIQNSLFMVVKFGEEFNDDNEELLIIPHGSYEISVEQYIYECVVLGLPSKRVHPGVEDGSLDSDILDRLEQLQPKAKEEHIPSEHTDPRWDKLKDLLNK